MIAAAAVIGAVLLSSCKPLTDLDSVERKGSWTKGGITMDAKDHAQAWIYRPSAAGCADAYLDFDLGRSYQSFAATVGTSDDTNPSRRYDFRVMVDGVQRTSGTVSLGSTREIKVPVKNALRMRIEVMPRCGTGSGTKGRIAYASPLLTN